MAKITTIIDIGSNSMRMVVIKKTSRFGFYILNETKSKVQISQESYLNNGYLQKQPLQRAFQTLESFLQISKKYKAKKILCVATSALRDAPNKSVFINKVKKELNLNKKIIDGKKEAFFGAVATANLLHCNSFLTLDIGGGSAEIAFVKNKQILNTISLNIGTIRLKELFLDKNDLKGAKEYIISQLQLLPKEFNLDTIVVLGGTARALSKAIMKKNNYSLPFLHGFEYNFMQELPFLNKIINICDKKQYKEVFINKDRYDTIKSGAFIFREILQYLNINKVVTSGVGVREGVFLADMLRNQNYKFPANFNVSVKSLLDRFMQDKKISAYFGNNIKKLFQTLKPLHQLDDKYQKYLVIASKLSQIGSILNYYKNYELSSEFILNGLQYGFSHQERVLISIIIKYTKNIPSKKDIKHLQPFLPPIQTIQYLCLLQKLNTILSSNGIIKYDFSLDNDVLLIKSSQFSYLVQSKLKDIKTKLFITKIHIH